MFWFFVRRRVVRRLVKFTAAWGKMLGCGMRGNGTSVFVDYLFAHCTGPRCASGVLI